MSSGARKDNKRFNVRKHNQADFRPRKSSSSPLRHRRRSRSHPMEDYRGHGGHGEPLDFRNGSIIQSYHDQALQGARAAMPEPSSYIDRGHGTVHAPFPTISDMDRIESVITSHCTQLQTDLKNFIIETTQPQGLRDYMADSVQWHETIQKQLTAALPSGKNISSRITSFFTDQGQDVRMSNDDDIQLQKHLRNKDLEIAEMTTKCKNLERFNSELQQQFDESLRQSDRQRKSLEDEKAKLKSIIQNSNIDKNEPLDDEIISSFTDLRDTIESIVRGHLKMVACPIYAGENKIIHDFYKGMYREVNGTEQQKEYRRIDRTRAMIFNILFDQILAKSLFGVDEPMQSNLATLESNFFHNSETLSYSQAIEWRKMTVSCIKSLGQSDSTAQRTKNTILEFCEPLLMHHDAGPSQSKLVDMVTTLCNNAMAFTLRHRSSKSNFSVRLIVQGLSVQSQKEKEFIVCSNESTTEKRAGVAGTKICYTLFGALFKGQINAPEEIVLVKAHVVVAK